MVSNPSDAVAAPETQTLPISTNDEFDLVDIILALWAGKWLILSITLASIVITLIYLQIFPYYTVSLSIRPNSIAEGHAYDEINATGLLAVNNDSLLQLWIEDLGNYETLEQALIEHNYLPKKADETEQAFSRRLRLTARQYDLSLGAKRKPSSWLMEFTTHMPETDRLVLEQAFSQSNNNVRAIVEAKFRHNVHAYEQKTHYETERRLAFLKEQNQISHTLEIAAPNTAVLPKQSSPDDDTTSETYNTLTYLRGFKAIEAEIDVLQKRQEEIPGQGAKDLIDPRAKHPRTQQRSIRQDPKTAHARLVFNTTPVMSTNFRAVRYDVAYMDVHNKSILMPALAVILGGILGVLVLLIRNTVSAASNRANA